MTVTEFSAGHILLTSNLMAYATFGRDITRFSQLIEFLTWLSIILWSCVALTTLLRASAQYTHKYRQKYRKTVTKDASSTSDQNSEEKRHGYS
jgi:hypothetical protein